MDLYLVLGGIVGLSGLLVGLSFAVGRMKLVAQLQHNSLNTARLEEELRNTRRKAEADHQLAMEATDTLKRRVQEQAQHTAGVQEKLDAMLAERHTVAEKYVSRIGELEGTVREKDAQIARQEKEFRERVARLNAELRQVLGDLQGEQKAA